MMEPVDETHAESLEFTKQQNDQFNALKRAVAQWELPQWKLKSQK